MRAVAAASIVSGSVVPPDAAPASRSRRNCGLPAERSAASATTCGGSGCSSVNRSASRRTAGGGSGLTARLVTWNAAGGSKPPAPSRRVVTTSHGRAGSASSSASSSPLDAASMWCACSNSSTAGPGNVARRSPITASCIRALRNALESWAACGVSAASKPSGTASSGIHGTSPGSCASISAASRSRTASDVLSKWMPRMSSSSSRHGAYGVAALCASQVARAIGRPAASSRSASTRRDLPIPGSPHRSTRRPLPPRAAASASRICASSSSRPISPPSGSPSSSDGDRRTGAPTSQASTGRALPFICSGGSAVRANRVEEWSSTPAVA